MRILDAIRDQPLRFLQPLRGKVQPTEMKQDVDRCIVVFPQRRVGPFERISTDLFDFVVSFGVNV